MLPDDLRMRLKSPAAKTTPYRASPSGLFKHVADRTIVFVGNLPSRVSQAELRKLFASSGTVRGVEILSRNAFDGKYRAPQDPRYTEKS